MKIVFKLFIGLIFLLFAVTGCTGKSEKPIEHRSGFITQNDENSTILENKEIKVLQNLEGDESYNLKRQSKNYNPNTDIIIPLSKIIFSADGIIRKDKLSSEMNKIIYTFNQAHIDLWNFPDDQISKSEKNKILLQYESLLKAGCIGETLNYCHNIEILALVSNSYDLWKIIIQNISNRDPIIEMNNIRIGRYLLNDRKADISLDIKYLQLTSEFEKKISELEKVKRNEKIRDHYSTLGMIIEGLPDIFENSKFQFFAKNFFYENRDLPFLSIRNRLKTKILFSKPGRRLWSVEWFQNYLKEINSNNSSGYVARLSFIKNNTRNVLSNFGVVELDSKSEIFYLVDNYLAGHWDLQFVDGFLQENKYSKKEFSKFISDYFKILMLAMVVESNKEFADFYKNRNNYSSNDLHTQVRLVRDTLFSRWIHLHEQAAKIRNIAELVLGKSSNEYKSLNIESDSINENVYLMVSYPLLIVMGYEMVVNKFLISGIFREIDHNLIIEAIFNGKLDASFFDFSVGKNNFHNINTTSLLMAYSYALQAETFESFGTNIPEFLRVTSDALIQNTLTESKRVSNRWLQQLDLFSNDYGKFVKICKNQDLNSDFSLTTDLFNLTYGVIAESETGSLFLNAGGGASLKAGTYPWHDPNYTKLTFYSNIHHKSIETFRSNLSKKIEYLNNMVQISRFHLEKNIKSNSSAEKEQIINEQLRPIRKAFYELNHEYRKFFSIVYKTWRDFLSSCAYNFAKKEFFIQSQIIRYEAEYLKQLYRDYVKLKKIKNEYPEISNIYLSNNPEVINILNKYKTYEYQDNNFFGFDHFDLNSDSFEANYLDATLRFKKYLEKGLITDSMRLSGIYPKLKIILPNIEKLGEPYDNRAAFINRYNFNIANSPEEFANYYIKLTMKASSRGIIKTNYIRYNNQIEGFLSNFPKQIIRMAALLFKIGEVEIYDFSQKECFDMAMPLTECKVKKEKITDQELSNVLFSYLSIFPIAEDEKDIFALFGLNSRGIPGIIKTGISSYTISSIGRELFFDPTTNNPIGFYDNYLYCLMSEQQGDYLALPPWGGQDTGADQSVVNTLLRAKEFAAFHYAMNDLIFSPDQQVIAYLKNYFKIQANRELNGALQIIDIAQKQELDDRKNGIVREFFIQNASGNSVKNFYLSPFLIETATSRVEAFHSTTYNLYR